MVKRLPRLEGTTARIRRLLTSMPFGKLFSTRDLLGLGKRGAVDKALWRMCRKGQLQRVARGVYCRTRYEIYNFTALEVALVKAKAFGKEIKNLLQPLKMLVQHAQVNPAPTSNTMGSTRESIIDKSADKPEVTQEVIFAVNGRSSSFGCGDKRIVFCGSAPRKIQLGDNRAGLMARKHWDMGSTECLEIPDFPQSMFWKISSDDRYELLDFFRWLPAWMFDTLVATRVSLAKPGATSWT